MSESSSETRSPQDEIEDQIAAEPVTGEPATAETGSSAAVEEQAVAIDDSGDGARADDPETEAAADEVEVAAARSSEEEIPVEALPAGAALASEPVLETDPEAEPATEPEAGPAEPEEDVAASPRQESEGGEVAVEAPVVPPKKKRKRRARRKGGSASTAGSEQPVSEEEARFRGLQSAGTPIEGRVFGWNKGGFHVVIDGVAAFCPRSEMESDAVGDPEPYVDKTFDFRVMRVEESGRRIIVSRAALLRKAAEATIGTLEVGAVLKGTVSSLTDFGAFVDIGGVEGLIHVSEISRQRVGRPDEVLEVGQEVEVKIIRMERGGRRISLSMKALLPDPWRGIEERYAAGTVVSGTVERTTNVGAFIALEPGLTGLLPTSEMGLPREALPARIYPPGREVKIQIVSLEPRRRRIGLAPEGSNLGGSRHDYMEYKKERRDESGFNALADAFKRADDTEEE